MIIAHLPAGYLLGRALSRLRLVEDARRKESPPSCRAAYFPDIDIIYFYLFDHRRRITICTGPISLRSGLH